MRSISIHVLFIGLALWLVDAEAVTLAGGDGSQNTSRPSDGRGWDYVGRITSANGAPSGVTYISNNWFITANHIKVLDNPTGVILNGSSYPIDPNSWTRLQNSLGDDADLMMFRVAGGTVGLDGVTVRTSTTLPNSSLTMIGNGRNRQPSESYWDVSWDEVDPPPPAAYSGYKSGSGRTKRWGTNKLDANAGLKDDGFGTTDVFVTDFDDIGGSEAQAATWDSGGGVFYNNGGSWELAGIMIFTFSKYGGQPANTAVYGNQTYAADMQFYAAQITGTAAISDIDEDGIPDLWEYDQCGSTIGVTASTDQDGDGYTGEDEWVADTDPMDGSSFPCIAPYSNATEIVFSSSTSRQYRIECKANLADTNESWQTEVGWFTPSTTQTVISVPASAGTCAYRLEVRL